MIQFLLIILGFFLLIIVGEFFYMTRERKKLDEEIKRIKESQIEKEEIKDSIDLNSHADSVNNMLNLLSKRKK